MRLAALVCLLAIPASAQTSFADGAGAFLTVGDLDVLDGDARTAVDATAGWRFATGVDVGVALEAARTLGRYSSTEVRAELGRTWTPTARVGVRLEGSAGYGWRTASSRGGGVDGSLDGATIDLQTTAYYHLPLLSNVAIRPTAGVFFHGEAANTDLAQARSLTFPNDLRDAAGVVIGLPLTVRVGGTGVALSPVVRLGMGLEDHAFYSDGGMRLHVNL